MKLKHTIIYFIAVTVLILIFSSFEAEFYFGYSQSLNLSDTRMYYAYTDKMSELDLSEVKKESYQNGDSSDFLNPYKERLYLLGYMDLSETNVFDDDMEAALKAYQTEKGFEPDGILTSQTMSALDVEIIEFKEGHNTQLLVVYQQKLIELNYLGQTAKADGVYGAMTRRAVEAYQKNNNLTVTGTINQQTQDALNRPVEDQIKAESPVQ